MIDIKFIYRLIVVVSLISLFFPINIPTTFPDRAYELMILSGIGLVLYIISFIGLLMLKNWGYYAQLAVLVIVIVLTTIHYTLAEFLQDIYLITGFVITGIILVLPIANKTLKREFFGN